MEMQMYSFSKTQIRKPVKAYNTEKKIQSNIAGFLDKLIDMNLWLC